MTTNYRDERFFRPADEFDPTQPFGTLKKAIVTPDLAGDSPNGKTSTTEVVTRPPASNSSEGKLIPHGYLPAVEQIPTFPKD